MIVIKGRIFDGNGGALIENGAVVVEGDKITKVCKFVELTNTKGAEIIEVRDGTVMPGLIDLHTHIGISGLFDNPYQAVITMLPKLNDMLESGFTYTRDCGGIGIYIKDALEKSPYKSPRISSAGMFITQTGGHGDGLKGMYMPSATPKNLFTGFGYTADGEAEVRHYARYVLSQGADFIKIATSSGVHGAAKTVDKVEFSEGEVRAVVEEAAHFGTYVASHCVSNGGIKLAIKCGVRTIEHSTFLDEEAAKMIADAGAYIVPTLSLAQVEYNRRDQLDPVVAHKIEMAFTAHMRTFELAFKYHLKIGCGTDFFPGPDNAMEYDCLHNLMGMDPTDILVSATKTGAEVLRRDDLGTLEAGKLADIIVVEGNPVENISLLRNKDNVKLVMQGGEVKKNICV